MPTPAKAKRAKAAKGVNPKTLASWKERLVQLHQARKDYLFHLRETDLTIGAPVTLVDKVVSLTCSVVDGTFQTSPLLQVCRVVELAGGSVALKESPPLHLSYKLSELRINDCRNFGSDALASTWSDCTRLRRLYAQNCPGVTDHVLHCVATTKRASEYSTQVLDIRRCRSVTDSGVGDIATSKQEMALQFLGLGHCPHVKAMAFFAFGTSRSLSYVDTLDIAGLDIDETAISWLTQGCRTSLVKLNVAHCGKLNDFCLDPDDGDSSLLTYLNLKNCVRIDDAGMAVLGQACLDLEGLNLRGVPRVTDIGLTTLAKRCTVLRSLKLSGCRNPAFYGRPDVGDDGLRALSKLCRHLTVLDLAGAPRVSSVGVAAIAATCPKLEKVTLTDTTIDDNAVLALAAQCPAIHTLHLTKVTLCCRFITDAAVEAIASGLFSLRTLSLAFNSTISNKSLVALAATKSPVESLDLSGDVLIDDAGLMALVAGCHRLRHVLVKGASHMSFVARPDLIWVPAGCDRLTEGCIRDCTANLPFCRPQPCPESQQLEPRSPPWISIYEHLVRQYTGACKLQASVRKWKQRDASLRWQAFLHMLSLSRNLDAILHVQAVYRGNKSRVKSRAWKVLATSSATTIQRGVKHHLYRRHAHARDIQRLYRGHRGRLIAHEVVRMRRQTAGDQIVAWARRCLARYEFHQRAKAISAHVRRIQRVYRSYARRGRLRRLVVAYIASAIRIQSVMRMVLAKAKVARRRVLYHSRSLRIQTLYRGYKTRRWFRHYKAHVIGAAAQIQAWVRSRWCRIKYLWTRNCIIVAQRRFRTYISIRDMHILALQALHLRRWGTYGSVLCEIIQRVYRGHLGRRRATLFRKIRRAKYAKKGQNATEFFVRRRFLRRGAAITIQRWFRPIHQRMRMETIHGWRVRQANLCIQRYIKGWLARVLAGRAKARLVAASQDMQRRAKRTLAARDKYKASLRGKLDLKLDKRERKFLLQRQIALMEISHKNLKRRRVGYEKKMEDVRAHRAAVWARANEVVYETYALKRNLVGASENVFVTKIELDEDLARQASLTAQLTDVHVKLTAFKQMLQAKIADVRVMDPVEFWTIARSSGVFDFTSPNDRRDENDDVAAA
ncbi:hypothetical protein DYB31_003041 [Aphanomyces astaci]|uniref:F-box/LRR-repeat protein 15-like leucin rich repeat domain-containing protein n=1 Tax=Aphanomyces astaci TaxID=112090 RepID=A0A397F7T0_APHAT|nr:hypothetical protein DYB31_003041 [Aphanomyces astaci]